MEIIEKAVAATGGRDVLDRFQVFRRISTASGEKDGKNYTTRTTTYVEFPDKLRIDQEVSYTGRTPFRTTITIIGDRVANETVLGFIQRKATKEDETRLRLALYLMECKSLIPLLGGDYQLDQIPTVPQDHAFSVRVRKAGKPDVTLLFDESTGLLIGLDCDVQTGAGRTIRTRDRYSDFRSFSGLLYATTSNYSEGPEIANTSTTELVEPLKYFPGFVPGTASQEQLDERRQAYSKPQQKENVRGRPSGAIVVTIQGGEIGIGKRQSYQPVRFELGPGDWKEIAFRRQDKPTSFRQIQVKLNDDGDTFYFDPGMRQIEIRNDGGWQSGRTYYPKEVKDINVGSGAKDITVHIRLKESAR